MEASFNPQGIEQALYEDWEQQGFFKPHGNGKGYAIAIPPPNITGSLHMGHAFQHTLMDALIRYQRMKGRRTLWQMGTDHAGIATQMLVERQINSEGKTRQEIGREAFLERVWSWKEQSGGNISQQIRRMGSSVDWSRDRFTMDEGFSRAVIEAFVQLHEQGLIYRGKRLVNWDPTLGTAISDLEVDNREEQGHLWHFRYPLNNGLLTKDGKAYLVVATTRPETMLGDCALAVHPDDHRYANLIGGSVRLPLVHRDIPIIADNYVDPEFGSGCVKITPAHDFNDNEVGQRHHLPLINVFNPDASMNDQVPASYRGLDRFKARQQIVTDLDSAGLLEKVDEHKLMVPRGDRSNSIIEPMLTDQWFVKIESMAEPAVAAVADGHIEFIPRQYENLYFAWMRDIKDWCISRQQWWGHRIPAYYDEAGNIYVGRNEAEVRARHQLDSNIELAQDTDVLETWFSSSLWTFGTLGWPDATSDLAEFHPTEVLVTGHDIIFFWVARMIMMTLKFTNQVPFKKIYMTGLVRDAEGHKMSKTRGNGLDPLDFIDGISLQDLIKKRTANLTQPQMAPGIEKATRKDFPEGIPAYGVDALRFTFCALASTGRDIRFDQHRIDGYRNFCNKLWNAARFVLSNTETLDLKLPRTPALPDRWIQSRALTLLQSAERALETYRFDLYANAVYEFAWHEYCDWYLELAKPLLWDESRSASEQQATQHTLLAVLEILLRIAHPIIPFITECIWLEVAPRLGKRGNSLMNEPFPAAQELPLDAEADAAIEWLKVIVIGVRNIRGEANIKPSRAVPVLFQGGTTRDRQLANVSEALVKRLANIESFQWLDAQAEAPPNALALVGDLKVMVPLAGLIDLSAERARLQKEIDRKCSELQRVEGKLNNAKFVEKAPVDVVDKERQKAVELRNSLQTLEIQHDSLTDS